MKTMTRRRRRAAVLLEFVLTLPFTLIFLMMIIDMGRMYLAAGALEEAAWRAARVAAVSGGADATPPGGTSNGTKTVLDDAFYRSLEENQAGDALAKATVVAVQPDCTTTSDIVRVTARATVHTMTPGLEYLLGQGAAGDWNVAVAAVAQCEMAR